jgi:hypothetical protein
MKLKTTIAALAGLLFAVSSFAQGTVTFNNTPTSAVIDSTTGARVQPNVAIAGLYFSTDLGAVPDTSIGDDGFQLAATTPIAPNALFAGVYSGGTKMVPGVPEGTQVLFQVRAWSVGFASYAEALASGAPTQVGASNTGILTVGGTSVPTPATSSFVTSFDITPVPEPSTVVLGLLGGLGTMLLLRRRK